jgi:pyruvate dehydrogenase E2 component (dihydrolipoamide acetyltransferase)
MASEFRLPALGADMDEGTLVQWNVAPGSVVKRGDVVAVVETDKGAIDVEIFQDGVVREIVVQPGTKVPVGTVLALLEGAEAPSAAGPGPVTPVATAARLRISPAARKRAGELGIDVATLQGSGPGGVITLEDVERSPRPARSGAQAAVTPTAGDGMREAIAAAMSRSKREIPHYYLSTTVDVTAATDWLAAHNASAPVAGRLLFATLLLKAIALTCDEITGFSGFYRDGRFEASPAVHVGVAVALRGGGLVAPAILETAGKSLTALMDDFRALVVRARAGRLRASELAAPTIILTSLGESSVDAVFPIIQPPQVAIVGAGEVVTRPWIVEGAVQARQVVTLSLGADHRVTDGRLGAHFLARVAQRLADPGSL